MWPSELTAKQIVKRLQDCSFSYLYKPFELEGFNRQLRKMAKNKGIFPTNDRLFKMLYLAMPDITKKWTGRRRDWGEIHSQLEIFFANRISY